MELSFSRANDTIDQLINQLIESAGGIHQPQMIREMLLSALKIGQETDYLADLRAYHRFPTLVAGLSQPDQEAATAGG